MGQDTDARDAACCCDHNIEEEYVETLKLMKILGQRQDNKILELRRAQSLKK